jgi:hypothetical protein
MSEAAASAPVETDTEQPVVPPPVVLRGGQPTPGELAAIVAAVEQVWPRPPAVPSVASRNAELGGWRWSGRWWAPRQVAARRTRP